jgi:hypothetical protein
MRRTSLLVVGTVALLAGSGLSAHALAAQPGAKSRPLKILFWGAHITTGDYVFKAVSSLDGTGAAIAQFKISSRGGSVTGTSETTLYFRDGVSKQRGSFKQAAPSANGIIKVTGTGRCVGGTGIHKRERCSYTIAGTYNAKTNQNNLKVIGRDTR